MNRWISKWMKGNGSSLVVKIFSFITFISTSSPSSSSLQKDIWKESREKGVFAKKFFLVILNIPTDYTYSITHEGEEFLNKYISLNKTMLFFELIAAKYTCFENLKKRKYKISPWLWGILNACAVNAVCICNILPRKFTY